MATTLKLQDAVNWALPYLKNQPLDLGLGDPAVGTGNMVLQTIFSPPFKWRFNRVIKLVSLVTGQSDYPVFVPNFGSLEEQTILEEKKSHPMAGELALTRPVDSKRPTAVAAQFDDGQGNITFRTKELPDQAYTMELVYQGKAPRLVSMGSYLAPLPDDYDFLFNWGFLTVSSILTNDARMPIYEKYFIGKLLALQEGLDEQTVNIFLGDWTARTRTMAKGQASYAQGAQARST